MVIRLIFCTAMAVTSVDPMPVDAETLEWISRQRLEVDPSLSRIAEDMADASAEPLLQGWAERSRPLSAGTRVTRIFVSRAMPRDDLIAALTAAQEDRDTIVVFRGLPAGTGLAFFRQELVGWLGPFAHWSSPPQIQLDPPAFRHAGIESAPTVAIYEGSTMLGAVPGMISSDWLKRQVDSGRRGMLPAQGPTVEISEPDLLELMQTRLAAFDWQVWRREQSERLTQSMRPPELPHAERSQIRFHEPGFVVTADLEVNGQPIARAGDRINPLHHVPFSQQLLVFDATDEHQVRLARFWLTDWSGPTTLLTTAVPESDVVTFLERHSKSLGVPIQMYRADVGQAFGILRVPSRVRAEASRFRIDEVGPSGLGESVDDSL